MSGCKASLGVFQSRGLTAGSDLYGPATRAKWLKRLPVAHRMLAQVCCEKLQAAEEAQELMIDRIFAGNLR